MPSTLKELREKLAKFADGNGRHYRWHQECNKQINTLEDPKLKENTVVPYADSLEQILGRLNYHKIVQQKYPLLRLAGICACHPSVSDMKRVFAEALRKVVDKHLKDSLINERAKSDKITHDLRAAQEKIKELTKENELALIKFKALGWCRREVEVDDSISQNVGGGLYPRISIPKEAPIIPPMQERLDSIIKEILATTFSLTNHFGAEITYWDSETGLKKTKKVPERIMHIYNLIRSDHPSQKSAREKIELIKGICCPESSSVAHPSPVVSTFFSIPTTKKDTIDFLKKIWTSCEAALKSDCAPAQLCAAFSEL